MPRFRVKWDHFVHSFKNGFVKSNLDYRSIKRILLCHNFTGCMQLQLHNSICKSLGCSMLMSWIFSMLNSFFFGNRHTLCQGHKTKRSFIEMLRNSLLSFEKISWRFFVENRSPVLSTSLYNVYQGWYIRLLDSKIYNTL